MPGKNSFHLHHYYTKKRPIMSISTRPFHPLDVENNRRYKVTKGKYEDIPYRDAEGDEPHVWKGYICVPEDTTCHFSIDLLGHGYIEIGGEKVIDAKEANPGKTNTETKELKKGYHHITVHYQFYSASCQNPASRHPEVFFAKMGGKPLEIWDIDEPKNLMRKLDAERLLANYQGLVDYETILAKNSNEIWEMFGEKVAGNMANEQTCATRLSIALNRYGYRLGGATYLSGSSASNNVLKMGGDISILNPGMTTESDPASLGKHIIISAGVMSSHLNNTIMKGMGCDGPDYGTTLDYETAHPGDIVIFGDDVHVGMCPGPYPSVGSFLSGGIWLLHRDTLDDEPETQE